MIDVGAEIKALRISKGLTQENLADLIGTSQDRISKIENGRLRIKADEYLELKFLLQGIDKVGAFVVDWPEKQLVRG